MFNINFKFQSKLRRKKICLSSTYNMYFRFCNSLLLSQLHCFRQNCVQVLRSPYLLFFSSSHCSNSRMTISIKSHYEIKSSDIIIMVYMLTANWLALFIRAVLLRWLTDWLTAKLLLGLGNTVISWFWATRDSWPYFTLWQIWGDFRPLFVLAKEIQSKSLDLSCIVSTQVERLLICIVGSRYLAPTSDDRMQGL
jgi:hypothetical protein